MNQQVFNGNNIDLLKKYPDNYFDSVVTDPPYGLGKEPDAIELMKDWIENGYHEIIGKGFMGKEWDSFVPQPIFWKEIYRVLKPGGHILAFYGTRTYDWGVMSMRFAGFEVRDCIQWLYGSGFPKSHNIGKAINKMQINTKWEGWGTALKPANEPIVLARKPLEKGLSIAENILKWGVGGINIDASRIGTNGEKWSVPMWKSGVVNPKTPNFVSERIDVMHETNAQGRFPANIILTHHEDCECKGTKKVKSSVAIRENGASGFNGGLYNGAELGKSENFGYADGDGNETVENWDCHEDCPIRIVDQQSGVSKSSGGSGDKSMGALGVNGKYGKFELNVKAANIGGLGDKGGASRFFYVAKASKSERNKGLDEFEGKFAPTMGDGIGVKEHNEETSTKKQNFHPTVKPIKLMQYLVKMITPTNGIVLDPFCGSGTTGVACKIDGFNFVGLEQDIEYTKIAEGRINNYIIEPIQTEMF